MTALDLPYDLDAEAAVLGAVLYQPDVLTVLLPVLSPADFYLAKHQAIYSAMLDCFTARTPADVRLVAGRMKERGTLESAGGYPYLAHLMSEAPIPSLAESLARLVEAHALRRRLITAGGEIAAIGYDTARAIDEALADAAARLAAVSRASDAGMAELGAVMDELYERMSAGAVRGVQTGLADLDALLGGLCPGDLCVLAGRPGHGKTSAAMTIADTLARKGLPVMVVSLEMGRDELAQRLIAMHSGVGADVQRRGAYTADEHSLVLQAMGEIARLPIAIEDRSGITAADVRARVLRRAATVGPPALIAVDYLQRLTLRLSGGMNYSQAVGDATKALKTLAREVGAPVLLLSQLNRQIDGRSDHEPELSDLRESGDIEADADQIVFIVRPELYEAGDQTGRALLYLKKNRHGPPGRVAVQYDAPRTMLRDLSYRGMAGYG